jgi:hypothetical protein
MPQQVQQTLKAAKGKFGDPKAEGRGGLSSKSDLPLGAIMIGLFVGKAVMMGIGKVNWTARAVIGVLTAASVAIGDAIFYTLAVMKQDHISFMPALTAVLTNFWKIDTDANGGLVSIIFGLIGAASVIYSTRKPEFKARFVPLGSPDLVTSRAATAK